MVDVLFARIERPQPSRRFSVIVPVHNEAEVLERFLRTIRDGLPAGAEVVMSLNGCSDRSAAILDGLRDPRFHVVSTDRPSKAGAIRLAETIARRFPRFYVDADAEISGADLSRLAETLLVAQAMMVSPRIEFRYGGATVLAKAFNDVWLSTRHVRASPHQYVIGVSEAGRGCWGDMPDVIADDTFFALAVPPESAVIDRSATVVVRLPTTFLPIIGVRRRIALGIRQLRVLGYEPRRNEPLAQPRFCPRQSYAAVAVYCLAVATGRVLAGITSLDSYKWSKDSSSRRTS